MSLAKWRFCSLALCVCVLSILTGCASVTVGTEQSIKVETLATGGRAVEGADCELVNEKSKARVFSGGTASVRRSGGDLSVHCTLAGRPPAAAQVVSRANAAVAGNIIIGGGIGAAIDIGTGAAYTYPTWLQLVFGEERLFDRSDNRMDTPSAGTLIRVMAAPAVAATVATAVPPSAPASMPAIEAVPAVNVKSEPPAAVVGRLRKGDALEYLLTDLLTGNTAKVLYNVDRLSGDEISFNGGGRIEKLNGQVVSIGNPTGGYFDASSPPGGWGRQGLKQGMQWQAEYLVNGVRHELQAIATGESTKRFEGADLMVQRIEWAGWVYAAGGSSSPVGSRFKATVLYAEALGRVVHFEVDHRPAFSAPRRESLDLVRIWR